MNNAMSNIYDKIKAELYDGVVKNYFDYDKSFSELNFILNNFKYEKILELGVGTGNMALRVAKNNDFVGIDSSKEMLKIAQKKIISEGLENNVKFFNEDAEKFISNEKFNVVYSHSGPITAYRKDNEIFFIADSEKSMIGILSNTKRNLSNRGLFLVNIEEPVSKTYSPSENELYIKEVYRFDDEFHRKYTHFIGEEKVVEFELKSPVFPENDVLNLMRGLDFYKIPTEHLLDWYCVRKCK